MADAFSLKIYDSPADHIYVRGNNPFRSGARPESAEELSARIAALRELILRGEYVVDTRLLADRLIAAGVLGKPVRA